MLHLFLIVLFLLSLAVLVHKAETAIMANDLRKALLYTVVGMICLATIMINVI